MVKSLGYASVLRCHKSLFQGDFCWALSHGGFDSSRVGERIGIIRQKEHRYRRNKKQTGQYRGGHPVNNENRQPLISICLNTITPKGRSKI